MFPTADRDGVAPPSGIYPEETKVLDSSGVLVVDQSLVGTSSLLVVMSDASTSGSGYHTMGSHASGRWSVSQWHVTTKELTVPWTFLQQYPEIISTHGQFRLDNPTAVTMCSHRGISQIPHAIGFVGEYIILSSRAMDTYLQRTFQVT